MHKNVLLYSGGLDSFIGYWFLKKEYGLDPVLLYVDLGHRYAKQELTAIRTTLPYMNPREFIIDNSLNLSAFEQDDAFIPNRNAFLAQIGALYGYNIWLITQKGETNIPDRSKEFYEMMSQQLTYLSGDSLVNLDTPFWDMNKTDMVNWYVDEGLDIQALKYTHSCYHPVKKTVGIGNTALNLEFPCGCCGACFRRWVSMSLNGIEEQYAVAPWSTKLAQEYWAKGRAGFYGEKRDKDILEALERKGVIKHD